MTGANDEEPEPNTGGEHQARPPATTAVSDTGALRGTRGNPREVPLSAMKNYSGEVFSAVASGEYLHITRYRQPIASLAPTDPDEEYPGVRSVSILELKTFPGKHIDAVTSGESLLITRKHQRIAVLSPVVKADQGTPAENPEIVYANLPGLTALRNPSLALERSRRAFL